jgi:glucokinase
LKPETLSLSIGIDLGGTNIKAALVDTQSAKTLATLSKPTRDGEFENDTPRFALTVREIVHEFEAQAGRKLAVGLSAPGLANPDGSCIDWMPGRMHGLEKLDWCAFLERDCRVLNDAHAALLGEVWAGAAKNTRDAFMLTLGTGVGGAIYTGGRLLTGKIGRAGHLGHISIDTNARAMISTRPAASKTPSAIKPSPNAAKAATPPHTRCSMLMPQATNTLKKSG